VNRLELIGRSRLGEEPLDLLLERRAVFTLNVELVLQSGDEGLIGIARGDRRRGWASGRRRKGGRGSGAPAEELTAPRRGSSSPTENFSLGVYRAQ
jgi:hypothetical protein